MYILVYLCMCIGVYIHIHIHRHLHIAHCRAGRREAYQEGLLCGVDVRSRPESWGVCASTGGRGRVLCGRLQWSHDVEHHHEWEWPKPATVYLGRPVRGSARVVFQCGYREVVQAENDAERCPGYAPAGGGRRHQAHVAEQGSRWHQENRDPWVCETWLGRRPRVPSLFVGSCICVGLAAMAQARDQPDAPGRVADPASAPSPRTRGHG